jgi:hypothetical protein
VRFVFIQETSGDMGVDASAGRILEEVRFRAGGAEMRWGFATFYWGSEVYVQPGVAAEGAP